MKIVSFLGIRPDLIRMAKLLSLLDKGQKKGGYEHIFVHSGQHYDHNLDGQFYEEMNIRRPDLNLQVGKTLKESGKPTSHAFQTALLFERTAEMLEKIKPDVVLYLGDTNTVLSSIVVARYGISVVHIEGGGRSYDWRMPEEKNRIVIDHLSDMIYCYLPRYREILLREGIPSYRIKVVGNIIDDPIKEFVKLASKLNTLKRFGLKKGEYCLVTLHREENTTDRIILEDKIKDLIKLSRKLDVILPIMPRVKGLLEKYKLMDLLNKSNIIKTEPLGFLDFINLEKDARLIVSDSGTVQEEALIFGVPCLITRLSTERPDTISAGATILSNDNLYENAIKTLSMKTNWDRTVLNPMGKSPSETIYDDLIKKFNSKFFENSRKFNFIIRDYVVDQAYGLVD